MISIGIDAGTSMVKSVAYDEDGTELAVASRPTRVRHPEPGWAEQDMAEVWQAVTTTITELRERAPGPVRLIALTAQGDGCWLVDEQGQPTGPAALWNDARAVPIASRWADAGLLDQIFRITGSTGFAGLPHAQLAWFAAHQPQRVESASAVLTCGGWLFHQLTGRIAIDASEAANPFGDARAGGYAAEVLELLDLGWARRLLPEIVDGASRVAELDPAAAEQLGVATATPVVLAPYDILSTALGAGVAEPGQACTILGTTICTEVLSAEPRLDRAPVGMTLPSGIPGNWMLAYATLAGTEIVDWTCRLLGLPNPEDLTDLAEHAEPGCDGLLLLPYLSPGGERAPFYDPAARGTLLGMNLAHGPAEIARACLEGLALAIQDCLIASEVQPTELRLTGGGSANPLWRQIIADLTGLPVVRSTDRQAGARGALVLAIAELTGQPVSEVAARMVGTEEAVRPRAEQHRLATEQFERFRAARDALRPGGWFHP
ncbi:xylulokinase/erythritol kinase [Tamaricihabitans halophyticus]|uniref:Xylulokinase/erythritol kinase n=1 Tax=Tamaricihabitans halophyticus TaxID=1262583 RepID=A0A4V2SUV9_9PSEU|nr:FGGY-family carbohydrate kinase [Tamaricihabitans halophyticus]TCP56196.1 xylulokinase/erythritol kinase [Tamaricihabitans halophyticus]